MFLQLPLAPASSPAAAHVNLNLFSRSICVKISIFSLFLTLSLCLFIYPSASLCVFMAVCLFSFYLFVNDPQSIRPSVCSSVRVSVWLYGCLTNFNDFHVFNHGSDIDEIVSFKLCLLLDNVSLKRVRMIITKGYPKL